MIDLAVIAIYLFVVVAAGIFVGRFTTSTQDFFLGGQRFPWWVVAISSVATLVGSYSFIQYAQVGYEHGFANLGPYTNDWFVIPFFLLIWLPILYFKRITSIPEYFERRFDTKTKKVVLIMLMVYLIGYIGINLLTIGIAVKGIVQSRPFLENALGFNMLNSLPNLGGFLDWSLIVPAALIAFLSGLYLHSGGQTSVLITDVLQGLLLLFAGLLIFGLGLSELGGFGNMWELLPEKHRLPFADFNQPADFNFIGDFWNDAIIGTFAFYCINQGILMRYLSARSVHEGRKALIAVALIMAPVAAIAVGGSGWIGRALVESGAMQAPLNSKDIFVAVTDFLARPGIFGLIIAAVIAALMSTLDTLIAAVSAIVVNDIIKPLRPGKSDEYYLKIAKHSALIVTVGGLALIPIFDQFGSVYKALSHFTSMVIPPLVIVMLWGTLNRRFSASSAFWTLVIGATCILTSLIRPELITPFAHGVDPSGGFSYMRGLFGLICAGTVSLLFYFLRDYKLQAQQERGLTIGDIELARELFKGAKAHDVDQRSKVTAAWKLSTDSDVLQLPASLVKALKLEAMDMIFLADQRWWLGGLRSFHSSYSGVLAPGEEIIVPQALAKSAQLRPEQQLVVEKIM